MLLLTITRCRRRCHLSLLPQMVGVIDASTYEGMATTLFGHSQSVRTLVWSLQSKGEGHKIPWDEFIAFAEKDDHIPTSAEDWEKFVEVLAMLDVKLPENLLEEPDTPRRRKKKAGGAADASGGGGGGGGGEEEAPRRLTVQELQARHDDSSEDDDDDDDDDDDEEFSDLPIGDVPIGA